VLPAEDPAALRELNYAERRGAMYLLFSAAVLPGQLPWAIISDQQGRQCRGREYKCKCVRAHHAEELEDLRKAWSAGDVVQQTIPAVWRL
jgi:hypothetical protein